MRLNILILTILSLLILSACDSKKRVKAPGKNEPAAMQGSMKNGHTVQVEEIVMSPSYMYLRVTESGKEYWIATSDQPVEVGMTLYFDEGMEMKDFTSKELDKTFESLWFVGQLKSASGNVGRSEGAVSPFGGGSINQEQNVEVEKVTGGVSIAELYTYPSAYEGKNVSIRAKVTKFNSAIMGRNWVHLQDGTRYGDKFDITLTTTETVKVGDEVIFTANVVLNQDFGAGYKYDIILEKGVLAQES